MHDALGFSSRSARVNDEEWKVCLDGNHRLETEAACIRLYIYFLATSCKEARKEFIRYHANLSADFAVNQAFTDGMVFFIWCNLLPQTTKIVRRDRDMTSQRRLEPLNLQLI